MAVLSAFRASQSRVLRRLGGSATVKIRKPHTLHNATTRKAIGDASYPTLFVDGARLAGATTITLDAPNLKGRLPAGCKFTIAGNATVYTTTADANVSAGELANVPITPALAANAADDAAVTITRTYGEHTFYRHKGPSEELYEERAGGEVRVNSRRYHLVAEGATVEPEDGDDLVDGTRVYKSVKVRSVDAGGGTVRWVVEVGEAA